MPAKRRRLTATAAIAAATWASLIGSPASAQNTSQTAPRTPATTCSPASVEATVTAGQSYEAPFAPGLRFRLEAIASGWIVRVLEDGKPREAHDLAELATPPYQSVTPLAISTDFSFRAQDAAGWNPRRFRYAADSATFAAMKALYPAAVKGDATATGRLAALVAAQPEAVLTILNVSLAPGTNDQAPMAAAVASHLESTPHNVDLQGASPLGKLSSLHFRVTFAPQPVLRSPGGVSVTPVPCSENKKQPTLRQSPASQDRRSLRKKP